MQIPLLLLYKNTRPYKNKRDTGINFNLRIHLAREHTTLMLTRQLELTKALI
jgi:hypothetical protein